MRQPCRCGLASRTEASVVSAPPLPPAPLPLLRPRCPQQRPNLACSAVRCPRPRSSVQRADGGVTLGTRLGVRASSGGGARRPAAPAAAAAAGDGADERMLLWCVDGKGATVGCLDVQRLQQGRQLRPPGGGENGGENGGGGGLLGRLLSGDVAGCSAEVRTLKWRRPGEAGGGRALQAVVVRLVEAAAA